MIITKIILADYGVYGGRHEFDFAPAPGKPVILIGGTNGAGKTTLFEATTLCLYGISAADKRITKKTYEKFLAKKIHRYQKSSIAADHASVVVQFKFYHNARETEYRVERSWHNKHGRIEERLDIKKRSSVRARFEQLDTVEASHWQSFVSDLIPKGIVRLFFFDGEKVVKMAKEGLEDATVRDSFKSLLGIEVVEQLHTDLQVNLTRNLTGDDRLLQEEIAHCESERDEAVGMIERLYDKLAQKQTDMDALSNEIESAESDISRIGGAFASRRNDAKSRLSAAKAGYEVARRRITDVCSDALPLALIPAELEALSKQIDADTDILQGRAGAKMLNKKIRLLMPLLNDACKNAELSMQQKRMIKSAISKFMKKRSASKPVAVPMFGFSEPQVMAIKSTIRRLDKTLLPILRKETTRLVKHDEEINTLESTITSAPADDEIEPLISRASELNSQRGALREEMNHIEEKIASNKALKQHMDSKMRDLVSKAYNNRKSRDQIQLTQDVQKVLEEFIDKLKTKKIRLLEQYLLDATDTLMHKKNLIQKIRIDPKTFEITLYGQDGKARPKDMMSEGEKQMFSISVLWALAKTSGRPLPFMIDTPLARLDHEHRTSLVERLLPVASHQILVFSTDKEIEWPEYKIIAPYTARAYRLAYDEDTGSTSPRDGYFWDTEGKKIAAV